MRFSIVGRLRLSRWAFNYRLFSWIAKMPEEQNVLLQLLFPVIGFKLLALWLNKNLTKMFYNLR